MTPSQRGGQNTQAREWDVVWICFGCGLSNLVDLGCFEKPKKIRKGEGIALPPRQPNQNIFGLKCWFRVVWVDFAGRIVAVSPCAFGKIFAKALKSPKCQYMSIPVGQGSLSKPARDEL